MRRAALQTADPGRSPTRFGIHELANDGSARAHPVTESARRVMVPSFDAGCTQLERASSDFTRWSRVAWSEVIRFVGRSQPGIAALVARGSRPFECVVESGVRRGFRCGTFVGRSQSGVAALGARGSRPFECVMESVVVSSWSVGGSGAPPRECWGDWERLGGLRAASRVIRALVMPRGNDGCGDARITRSPALWGGGWGGDSP
jgi:hypothetical protein